MMLLFPGALHRPFLPNLCGKSGSTSGLCILPTNRNAPLLFRCSSSSRSLLINNDLDKIRADAHPSPSTLQSR